jgi:hypothetical protein
MEVKNKRSADSLLATLLLVVSLISGCGKSITEFKVRDEAQACEAIVNGMVDYILYYTPEDSKKWYVPPYWFGEPSDVTNIIYAWMFPKDREILRERILYKNPFLENIKYDTEESDLDYGFFDLRATLFESFLGPVFSKEQRKIISAADFNTRNDETQGAAIEILNAAKEKYFGIDCSSYESEISPRWTKGFSSDIWDEIIYNVFDEVMLRWEAIQSCESRPINNRCNS